MDLGLSKDLATIPISTIIQENLVKLTSVIDPSLVLTIPPLHIPTIGAAVGYLHCR